MKQYRVTMPDGTVWGVPVSALARNHAEYYAQYETAGDVEKCYNEHSLPLFLANPMEVWEWAAGNMDWIDVKAVAQLVSGVPFPTQAEYQDGWVDGDHKVVDVDETAIAAAPAGQVDLGWVDVESALPKLEHIAKCRAGKVEVAALFPGPEWILEQRPAADMRPLGALKVFWRYLPDVPTIFA